MSSRRFPGKVLAPFRGRPLIASVLSSLTQAAPQARVVVATSTEPSDDPLAAYLRDTGVAVSRGPLDDVLGRLQECLAAHPCRWFFRVCADSPLINVDLLQEMAGYADRSDLDLVTNVFPRTFPRGQSLELIAAQTFTALDVSPFDREAREHVTKVYYDHPERFRICNLRAREPVGVETDLAVDTVDDLRRLEALASERSLRAVASKRGGSGDGE